MKQAEDSRWTDPQEFNRDWWENHPMTYDWQRTLQAKPGTREWFAEIDRRFLDSAYYARGADGDPFGRFLRSEDVKDKVVLEVGCGMGTHAAMLARAGARLTTIDITSEAVRMTRQRFRVYGLPAKIIQADAEQLPFANATFDLVWSWGVIHHSSSTERCLSEMTRVLRPGGRLVMMVYHRRSVVRYLHMALIRGLLLGQLLHRTLDEIWSSNTDGFYARSFTKKELTAMLNLSYQQISMAVVGQKVDLLPIPRSYVKDKLERILPNWLASAILSRWGSMIVVEALRRHSEEDWYRVS